MLTYNVRVLTGRKAEFIYESIKKDIRNRELKSGEKLPSKRALAEHLGISVITVENAYAMLEEEGYIEAKPRSGFYVRSMDLLSEFGENTAGGKSREEASKTLTENETGISYLRDEQAYRFEDSDRLPLGMVKIMRQLLSDKPEILLEKPPHMGCAVLRNALADYLRRYRGMKVQPANIVIGSGAEYLYGMLVQLFGRDKVYGIEYPSYEKIEQVYISNGASTEHLAMAEDGINSAALTASRANILHVSPYHSYPTGITASASKRYEYLSWAGSREGYLIEDDFDSEFAFLRKPIEPMYSMDTNGRVVYLNTFSKSLAPSIRVAYMVLPDRLMESYSKTLGFYSCTVPVYDQYVLAEYVASGAFERHLNRIRRRIYRLS